MKSGKEDATRIRERGGVTALARPSGKLIWIHAASVGETNSILPLVKRLLETYPQLHILLTTVTVTSAEMVKNRLPERAFHQFAPVDTPSATDRFLAHWQPDIALWVDSEFWPNLIKQAAKRGTVMGIINARMSQKSFDAWLYAAPLIKGLLSCFSLCFAQSQQDASRLRSLGIPAITGIGNLKYDAPPLPYNEQELATLQVATQSRPIWVAASTHPGEEKMVADVHRALKSHGVNPLTIIVPRHAKRGNEILQELGGLNIAQRSKGQSVNAATDIYLADTMGELGLFYHLAPVAFIGGSLVEHGGQNPLEAARFGCAIVTGLHIHNFADVIRAMEEDGAILRVGNPPELASVLQHLFSSAEMRSKTGEAARAHVNAMGGAMEGIMNELRQYLS